MWKTIRMCLHIRVLLIQCDVLLWDDKYVKKAVAYDNGINSWKK